MLGWLARAHPPVSASIVDLDSVSGLVDCL